MWFQCEDCGENLKKPKLQNHFRGCSAGKLSCIDCGVVFNQQSVQGHTQCVSEAEKYGPKDVGCVKKETMKIHGKEQSVDGVDISLGLSARPPWSCSLCNVKTTSQETLVLHSQGKKHRSKARSMSSKLAGGDLASENTSGTKVTMPPLREKRSFDMKEDKVAAFPSHGLLRKESCISKQEDGLLVDEDSTKIHGCQIQHEDVASNVEVEVNNAVYLHGYENSNEQTSERKKKRNVVIEQNGPSESGVNKKLKYLRNGQNEGVDGSHSSLREKMGGSDDAYLEQLKDISRRKQSKVMAHDVFSCDGGTKHPACEMWSKFVKWRKLIKRTLKNAPNGSMKIKQLRKSLLPLAMKTIETYRLGVDEESLLIELDNQIHSYAKLIINGKKVRLANKGTEK